jgi:transposase
LLRPIRRNEAKWKVDPAAAKTFNAALSKKRVRIEHFFARLKTWRIIHHYYPLQPSTYATTFRSIAYINNLEIETKRSDCEL